MTPTWFGIFVQGMSAMGCVVIALFFAQFWRNTGDRLFLIFAVAFCLMCVTRVVAAGIVSNALASAALEAKTLAESQVHSAPAYVFRFLAYLLILAALIDKNR